MMVSFRLTTRLLENCTLLSFLLLASRGQTVVAAEENADPYEGCSEVFIGGGWAGVYSFYRRVMEDPESRASKACLFEQSWRIGGRTYSVPLNHTLPYIQDIGAYRFSPDMHLPGDLIIHHLQLPTECYQETCPSAKDDFPEPFLFNYSAPLRRIVDPETRLPSGYATAIHKMIDILTNDDIGARVFTETSLVELDFVAEGDDEDNDDVRVVTLKIKDSNTGLVSEINDPELLILNLPRNKLFEIKGVEESLDKPVVDTLKCIAFDQPPDLFDGLSFSGDTTLLKAYMYFEDAFWHTKLNETVGPWPRDNHFFAHPTVEGVLFNIRWHDGPVQCSLDGTKCDGLLETYYSVSNETFYESLSPGPGEPLGSIWETDGPEAVEKLKTAHAGLIDILTPLLEEKDADPSEIGSPKGLMVGVWRRPSTEFPLGQGFTAPTKVYYAPEISGGPDKACGVPGLTDETYRDTVLRPWGSKVPIYLVNNDWYCGNVRYFFGDWAEESLLQAERAMLLQGSPKPEWLDKEYYQKNVVSKVQTMAPSYDMTIIGRHGSTGGQEKKTTTIGALLILACVLLGLVWKRYQEHKKRGGKDYTAIP